MNDGLFLLLVLVVPGVVLWLVFRKPVDGESSPRDIISMKAKSNVSGMASLVARDAAESLLRDADDSGGDANESHPGAPDDFESNELGVKNK